LAIGRTVDPHGPAVDVRLVAADIPGRPGPWMAPVGVLARSLTTVALAAFVILVVLPAAIAAQATMPI
jgi:hypothetical protein